MTMYRSIRFILIPCLFLLFVCLPIVAQTTNATLSGVVEDQKGAVVPGVKITVTNPATGLERSVVTDGSGAYLVPLLPPATYTVMAEREGFTRVQFPNIILNVNDQRSLRIELGVGSVEAAIEVRPDEGVTVRTDAAVATTIDRTFVGNLPLNGRSFSSLVLLTPGVTVTTSNTDEAGQFSVNGQRASTNYFTVDGVSANIGMSIQQRGNSNLALSGAYPGQSAFGGTNNLVSIDALEEFKIQTSTYTAENGRQPGGQIQLITRSGTNMFHGTLFEYFRNEAFDARNYFNKKPAPETPLRQNQFGGTFSGPLPFFRFGEGGTPFVSGKDRTFFFFSYEGQRLLLPFAGIGNVPSLRLRQIAAPGVTPVLNAFAIPSGNDAEILVSCAPGPTEPLCTPNPGSPQTGTKPSGFAPYNYSLSNPSNLDATSIRIDHTVDRRLTVFGRFNESPSDSSTGKEFKFRTIAKTRTLTFGATSVLSQRSSNELRINFSRQQASFDYPGTNVGGANPVDPLLLTSGYSGSGRVQVSMNNLGSIMQGGTEIDSIQRQLNIVDNFSLGVGSHQLKFGIDFRRLSPIYGSKDQQSIVFTSEQSVTSGLINNASFLTQQPSQPRFDNYSVYFQDTWKASRNLTLDLGLRWEINPAPTETDGRMPPLVFGVNGTDVSQATLAPAGTPFYKTFYTAFAPRLGAAYGLRTVAGSETVLRGGFGVYYDLGSGTAANGWPFFAMRVQAAPTVDCPLVFPISPACAARPGIVLATTLPTTLGVFSTNENLKLPFSLHWNLAVEQSLGKDQTLSVSYVASAGRRLLTTRILNLRKRNSSGVLLPAPNPNFGQITYSFNGPASDYHSMQAQYRARMKQGLQILINYTWSHSIDDVSFDSAALQFDRGNSNFDVRHNLSAALHYDIPKWDGPRFLSPLFRDWSFDAIVHAQSGLPLNIVAANFGGMLITGEEILGLGRPDVIPGVPLYLEDPTVPGGRRINAAAFQRPPVNPGFPATYARQGTLGRNVLRQLPLYQVDVSFGRTFKFNERIGVHLKADAFNVFNHPMFGNYGTIFTSASTLGVPSSTANTSLGGYSSLYQLGGPRSIQLSARFSF